MDIRLDFAGDAAAGVAIPFVLLLLCWIVTILGRVRIARRQSAVWDRVVDKLDAPGVTALMTQGGGRVLDTLLTGPDKPHARIIVAAQVGVLLLPIGLVLVVYAVTTHAVPTITGALVLALALGLGAAAFVGYWLSSRWGLLTPAPRD